LKPGGVARLFLKSPQKLKHISQAGQLAAFWLFQSSLCSTWSNPKLEVLILASPLLFTKLP
jgi:hypothetical protein